MHARLIASHALLTLGAAVWLAACSSGERPASRIEVAVTPLSLPDVVNACYGLAVLNESLQPVWTESPVCADQYGDLASSIAYIGTCDASDPNGDGVAEATVVLTLLDLYGPDTPADIDTLPDVLVDWHNPCAAPHAPDGCRIRTSCEENADTRVEFNLTIMRDAVQGFFDVAINFEDIFCSAKVDCAYPDPNGGPITLVFDPATGLRVQTVVWAFACTDGDPGGAAKDATHLYMDDLVLRCGATSYRISASAGPGNVYPAGVGAPAPLVQAMVFEGRERITNAGLDADKLYWNVALGLDADFFAPPSPAVAPSCVLETRATASHGPLVDGTTPVNTRYPYVAVSVPLNDGATIACTQHGLDGANPGVETAYTGPNPDGTGFASTTFGNVGAPSGTGITTTTLAPVLADVDECAAGTDGCVWPNPFCANTVSAFECYGTEPVGFGAIATSVDQRGGYVAVAASHLYSLALKGDGTVVGWGENGYGQASAPAGLNDVVAIAAGVRNGLALKSNGVVVAWGYAGAGVNDVPSDLDDAIAIACGGDFAVALTASGTVVAWGQAPYSEVPTGLSDVAAIGAGNSFTAALVNGSVVAWGNNTHGQTDVPVGLADVSAISVGTSHTLALTASGTVVAWGRNFYGQTDVPAGLDDVVAVAAGHEHSLALKADGTVVGWGWNAAGQATAPAGLGPVVSLDGGSLHTLALARDGTIICWPDIGSGACDVPAVPINLTSISAGERHNLAVTAQGGVVAWGGGFSAALVPAGLTDVVATTAGSSFSVALREDGTLITWGSIAAMPAGLTGVSAIAAGLGHVLALNGDGTLLAWGANGDGQTSVPAGLTGVVAIAAGGDHSLALLAGGTVVGWGDDAQGQSSVPAGLVDVVAIAAGQQHSSAVRADGTVVVWGNVGELSVPAGLDDAVAVASGYSHILARDAAGDLSAWGYNVAGQATVPAGLDAVVAMATGFRHSLVLRRLTWAPAPTVTGLSAGLGTTGQSITVTGTNFERVVGVRVNGRITRWTVDGPTQLRFLVPDETGSGPVEIETPTGVAQSATSFTAN